MSERPTGVGSVITVRFPAEDAAVLRRLCESGDQTATAIIRRAVRHYSAAQAGSISLALTPVTAAPRIRPGRHLPT